MASVVTGSVSFPYDRTTVKSGASRGSLVVQGQEREVVTFTKAGGNLTEDEISACRALAKDLSKYHESLAYDPNNPHLYRGMDSLLATLGVNKNKFNKAHPKIAIENFIVKAKE